METPFHTTLQVLLGERCALLSHAAVLLQARHVLRHDLQQPNQSRVGSRSPAGGVKTRTIEALSMSSNCFVSHMMNGLSYMMNERSAKHGKRWPTSSAPRFANVRQAACVLPLLHQLRTVITRVIALKRRQRRYHLLALAEMVQREHALLRWLWLETPCASKCATAAHACRLLPADKAGLSRTCAANQIIFKQSLCSSQSAINSKGGPHK